MAKSAGTPASRKLSVHCESHILTLHIVHRKSIYEILSSKQVGTTQNSENGVDTHGIRKSANQFTSSLTVGRSVGLAAQHLLEMVCS